MNPTFDLIDQSWIPCIRKDGSTEEVGLQEALTRAHQLRGVYGESPLVVAALHRLLLALLYRAFPPPVDTEGWERLWRRGCFDSAAIESYLERRRDRFDLFHPTHPFYQWRGQNAREKNVNDLIFHIASGNNATLFDHHTDEVALALTPGAALRSLLVVQAFSSSGTAGMAPKDSSNAPWADSLLFWGEGSTLFETLLLNLIPHSYLDGIRTTSKDRPIWETDSPFEPARDAPLGIADYLTWPNRALCLIPEESNSGLVVRRVLMSPGIRIKDEIVDPYKHYRIDKEKGYRPLKVQEYRSLWRDSDSLVRLREIENFHPPRTFYWLAELVADGVLERSQSLRFMALGLAAGRTDAEPNAAAAKIHFYQETHLPLPAGYLQDDGLVEKLVIALQQAEAIRSIVTDSIVRLATLVLSPTADDPNGRKPDRKDVSNLLTHWAAERHYWSELEPAFYDLMIRIPQHGEDALAQWTNRLLQSARSAFALAERSTPDDARGLRAAVRAKGQMEGGLKRFVTDSQAKEHTL